jgi:hypothetical protein
MIQKAASFRVEWWQMYLLTCYLGSLDYIYIYIFQSTKSTSLSEIFRNIQYFNMKSSRIINSSMNICWRHIYIYIYIYGTITDLYHGTIMFGKHHKFCLHPYHRHSFFYIFFNTFRVEYRYVVDLYGHHALKCELDPFLATCIMFHSCMSC